MSGRYTFTAGNTLTASQMNTYVMNGIPYQMAVMYSSVTGSLAITFPITFSAAPMVWASVNGSNATTGSHASYASITTTGCTIYVWQGTTASSTAKSCSILAICMANGTATGNS